MDGMLFDDHPSEETRRRVRARAVRLVLLVFLAGVVLGAGLALAIVHSGWLELNL